MEQIAFDVISLPLFPEDEEKTRVSNHSQTSPAPTAQQRAIALQLGIDPDRLARDINSDAGASRVSMHSSTTERALVKTASYDGPSSAPKAAKLPSATDMYEIAKMLQLDPADLTRRVLNSKVKTGLVSFSTRELRGRGTTMHQSSYDFSDLIESAAAAVDSARAAQQAGDQLGLEMAAKALVAQGSSILEQLAEQ